VNKGTIGNEKLEGVAFVEVDGGLDLLEDIESDLLLEGVGALYGLFAVGMIERGLSVAGDIAIVLVVIVYPDIQILKKSTGFLVGGECVFIDGELVDQVNLHVVGLVAVVGAGTESVRNFLEGPEEFVTDDVIRAEFCRELGLAGLDNGEGSEFGGEIHAI